MKINVYEKLCSNINYNTYKNIRTTLKISSVTLGGAGIVLVAKKPDLFFTAVLSLSSLILVNTLLHESNGLYYTKDYNQIKELYQQFISNYNGLNKTFELNNPIEIHTLFTYLLFNGYLSIGKEFNYSFDNVKDLKYLLGTDVITGKGVCRHISAMLTDILNDYDIESNVIDVYSKNPTAYIFNNPYDTDEEFIDDYLKVLSDSEMDKAIATALKNIQKTRNCETDPSIELVDERPMINARNGNHAISYAFKDGKSYFLDPTQNRIYKLSEYYNNMLYDNMGKALIKYNSVLTFNTPKYNAYKHLEEGYSYITQEEEKNYIDNTKTICQNNNDIFDKFYNENKELYSELSSKLLRIRK